MNCNPKLGKPKTIETLSMSLKGENSGGRKRKYWKSKCNLVIKKYTLWHFTFWQNQAKITTLRSLLNNLAHLRIVTILKQLLARLIETYGYCPKVWKQKLHLCLLWPPIKILKLFFFLITKKTWKSCTWYPI